MLFRVFFLALAFFSASINLQAGLLDNIKQALFSKPSEPSNIDVLIVNDQPNAMLEVGGKYKIIDPNTNQHISKRFLGKRKQIESLSSGLKWGEEFPGIYQLQIVPEEAGGVTTINGVDYRGSIFVYDIGGAISIVNRVAIEDYLNSMLPGQIKDDLADETLAAFVIASRTNAYYYTKNPLNKYWAVDGNQVGYKGMQTVNFSSSLANTIKNTRGMVLSKTGKYEGIVTPFAAVWDASSGIKAGGQSNEVTRVSLWEANNMAKNGQDAAQILSVAFPGSHIEVILN